MALSTVWRELAVDGEEVRAAAYLDAADDGTHDGGLVGEVFCGRGEVTTGVAAGDAGWLTTTKSKMRRRERVGVKKGEMTDGAEARGGWMRQGDWRWEVGQD